MRDIVKSIGGFVIGIAIFLGIAILAGFLLKGGIWLSVKILPWLTIIMWFVFIVDLVIILPLGILKKTKGFSSIGLVVSSYVYGLTLWFWSLLITYLIWGLFAVFVGLFIAGVGVVPIAIIASVFKGEWDITWQILLLVFLTFGTRILGYYFAKRADEIAYSDDYYSSFTNP